MTVREIGGYLGLEDCGGAPYHEGAIALDSARSCLAYLAELRGIRSIALPDLMCSAVPQTCDRVGCMYRTYRVGKNFLPVYDFELADGEWLYLADYYGTLTAKAVSAALEFADGRVVVDEVQGFFRRPWVSADTIYTCRKYFGVPDGAYLATCDGSLLNRALPVCRSIARMAHVLGRAEDGASAHYAEYSVAEEGIGRNGPEAMSEVTRRLLSGVDYVQVKEARERNFAVLAEALGQANMLDPGVPEGPYMYPFLVPDANGVRQMMAAEGVFIPMLWPNVSEDPLAGSVAVTYSRNILPLPVDQRYGAEDMGRLLVVLKDVLGLEQ